MIARYAVAALLPVVAVAALFQPRRLAAIVGMGLFSLLLAVTYLLLHAPDVALTEATIGAGLVAAIYVLAIRRTGRLTVVADEVPRLLAREGEAIVGLEQELLLGFARHLGLDLSVQLAPYREVAEWIRRGEADIGAGGLVPPNRIDALVSRPYLETALVSIGGKDEANTVDYDGYFADLDPARPHRQTAPMTLDLARFLALRIPETPDQPVRRHPERSSYAFLVPRGRPDLRRALDAYISGLEETGELDRLIRRYLR